MDENFEKIPMSEVECIDFLNEMLTKEEKDTLMSLHINLRLYTVLDNDKYCVEEQIVRIREKVLSSESNKFGCKLYRWIQNNWIQNISMQTEFMCRDAVIVIEKYINYLKVKNSSYNVAVEFEQFYAKLDDMLSDEDKNAILCSNNIFEFYSTLGKWIRNNWIYPNGQLTTVLYYMHPDDISVKIISGYQQHLRTKNNK